MLKLKEELLREAADVKASISVPFFFFFVIALLIRPQAQETAIDAMLKELEQKQQSTKEVAEKLQAARIRQQAVAEVCETIATEIYIDRE